VVDSRRDRRIRRGVVRLTSRFSARAKVAARNIAVSSRFPHDLLDIFRSDL